MPRYRKAELKKGVAAEKTACGAAAQRTVLNSRRIRLKYAPSCPCGKLGAVITKNKMICKFPLSVTELQHVCSRSGTSCSRKR